MSDRPLLWCGFAFDCRVDAVTVSASRRIWQWSAQEVP